MTDAESEAPIFWPPDVNSNLLEKTLMLGKIEGHLLFGRKAMTNIDSILKSRDITLRQ